MTDSVAEVPKSSRPAIAHRIVQTGLFLSLTWKWFFFRYAADIYAAIPLDDPFFPDWLRSVYTISIAYLAAVARRHHQCADCQPLPAASV